jgi:hypothetical protein
MKKKRKEKTNKKQHGGKNDEPDGQEQTNMGSPGSEAVSQTAACSTAISAGYTNAAAIMPLVSTDDARDGKKKANN